MTITQSTSAPLVVIGGATGNQGGSVLQFLQESDKEYRLRALTRDASKPKAKALLDLGVDVVAIDLKPENQDRIQEAYSGADVVFAVTNFWEHVDVDREVNEGKAMVDAAIAAGVKLFIYSSLPNFIKKTNGEIKNVHHFEGKARIEEYARSKASPGFQFVAVQAGNYNSNFFQQSMIRKGPDGTWTLYLPVSADTVLPSIDIDEYGLWVRAAIEQTKRFGTMVGRYLSLVKISACARWYKLSQKVSPRSCLKSAGGLSSSPRTATGTDIRIIDNMSFDDYRKTHAEGTPEHIKDDMADMWKGYAELGFFQGVDVQWPLKYLAKKPSTFAEWLERADLSEYKK